MSKTWYAVTLILKCIIEDQLQKPTICFEQIHLIEADDNDLAYKKAVSTHRVANKVCYLIRL